MGGTKNGLLFGECLVIVNPALMPNFRFALKQGGGMLAKGRLLGVQFGALLKDDLWLQLGRRENELAARLTQGLRRKGCAFYASLPPTRSSRFSPKSRSEGWRRTLPLS